MKITGLNSQTKILSRGGDGLPAGPARATAAEVCAAVMAAVMLVSCAKTPKTVLETTYRVSDVKHERRTDEPEAKAVTPEFVPGAYTVDRPLIEKTTESTKDIRFFRDGQTIYGRITFPEGKGPFRTIVISSGLYAQLGRYESKAKSYGEKGFCVIEFSFQNGTPPPSYEDPEYLGDFIYEQVLDLYAVMDSLEYLDEVDLENVYLYGHSMGGLVASYAGTYRQDEVRGMILVDPSFYATDLMEFEKGQTITTDIYPLIRQCGIPVAIITGTQGSFGEDLNFYDDARAAFPHCQYIVIDGADHRMDGEASEKVVRMSVKAIESWG